jgi:seryl-tRNA synthetase
MSEQDYELLRQKVNAMEVDLSALKEKVSFFHVIYGKFDVTLGKIQEMIENRRYENNEDIKDVYVKLAESEGRLLEELKAIRQDMKDMNDRYEKRISELDRWKWMLMGGAVVAGWLLARIAANFQGIVG